MKQKYLKLIFMFAFTQIINSQTSGGPDGYGYNWINSNDTNGPVINWIDISTTGTEIIGLGDDNAIGMISMGINFEYYGNTYNSFKIGSNGWISFNNIPNIASCFQIIPTAGGAGENLVCPFMTDLNFAGATNSAKAYYQIYQTNKFVISFINVPLWTNSNPDFIGDNTFQIILDNTDNSITFQYLNMDDNFLGSTGCSNTLTDSIVGIENQNGLDGLQILGDEIMPSDNFVIRIEDSNTLSIPTINKDNKTLKIFPNPSKDYINISGAKESDSYEIYNILGYIVKKGEVIDRKPINIEKIDFGMYFIKVNNKPTIKFIKK